MSNEYMLKELDPNTIELSFFFSSDITDLDDQYTVVNL